MLNTTVVNDVEAISAEEIMGNIVHIEITADNIDRAAHFYNTVFNWQLKDSPFIDKYKMAETGEGSGIDGAIMSRAYRSQPTIAWINVKDISQTLDNVQQAGGKVIEEKKTIPHEGQVAYIQDSEGNTIGIKQPIA
jgi:predicted enzyme related to lactoylglutathione lyase